MTVHVLLEVLYYESFRDVSMLIEQLPLVERCRALAVAQAQGQLPCKTDLRHRYYHGHILPPH